MLVNRSTHELRDVLGAIRNLENTGLGGFLQLVRVDAAEYLRLAPEPTTAVPRNEIFIVGIEDAKIMSGCDSEDHRKFLQWFVGKSHYVLTHRNHEQDGSKLWLLDGLRAALLSCRPKSPIEALLITQYLCSHELALEFAGRAMRTDDSTLASKLTARYVQLASVACQQAETIQKLRGETSKQVISVQHLNVSEGGRAVLGQVHASIKPEEGE